MSRLLQQGSTVQCRFVPKPFLSTAGPTTQEYMSFRPLTFGIFHQLCSLNFPLEFQKPGCQYDLFIIQTMCAAFVIVHAASE